MIFNFLHYVLRSRIKISKTELEMFTSSFPLETLYKIMLTDLHNKNLELHLKLTSIIEFSHFNYIQSGQFSSVAQSCLSLCDPMNCSMPGLPVHHQLPEFTQTHVHDVKLMSIMRQWCHPAISSSVVPFSFCPQSLPALGSFPMSQLFTWGGQSIGLSASASILPMNTQDWSPLGWTGWISLQAKGLSRVLQHHSSKASILQCSAIFTVQLSHPYMTTGKTKALTRWTFVGKVMSLLFKMLSKLVITFLPRSKRLLISWLQSQSAVIFQPPKIKSDTVSTVSPSIGHKVMGLDALILVFWMLSFKPTFSLSSFTFIRRLFSSSSLSAIRVVSSAHLKLLIFLLEILGRAYASSSPEFLRMYSAYKLNKQGDSIQPWRTPFPIWNQSVVPCPVLTVASWPAYIFLKRQVRWSGIPISFRIFQSLLWSTQSKALA